MSDETDFIAALGHEFVTEMNCHVAKVARQDAYEVFSLALGEEPMRERLEQLDDDDYEALQEAAVEYFEEDAAGEADFAEIVRITLDHWTED